MKRRFRPRIRLKNPNFISKRNRKKDIVTKMKTLTLLSLVEITGKTGLETVTRTMSQMQIIYKVNSPKFLTMQQETKNKEHSKGLCQIRK